ncbi:Hypothetical predicted protein [Prunus dulcis]|uniref:Uncharacterized protein n=1 Tax=Prunus dulcis TaxID=3755 RepID=A0A5E4FMS5_PRUDU|nr:Hypothetical predicted protein [Prunus dulcis]
MGSNLTLPIQRNWAKRLNPFFILGQGYEIDPHAQMAVGPLQKQIKRRLGITFRILRDGDDVVILIMMNQNMEHKCTTTTGVPDIPEMSGYAKHFKRSESKTGRLVRETNATMKAWSTIMINVDQSNKRIRLQLIKAYVLFKKFTKDHVLPG